jgi:hypothetical protein
MGRKIILGMLFVIFSSCSKSKMERPLLFYNQNQLNLISNESGFDANRTGNWEMFEDSGKLLQKGTLDQGLPTGQWSYFLSKRNVQVKWGHYSDNDLDLVVPNRWVIDSNNKLMFFAVLSKGEIDATKNFCIGIRTENPSWTLEDHFQKLKALVKPIDSSSQKDNYLLQSSDSKVYFQFTKNTVLPNGEGPVNTGMVLFEKSSGIYELTIVSETELSSDEEVKLLIVEMFKAMKIENEFMLNSDTNWNLSKIIERE